MRYFTVIESNPNHVIFVASDGDRIVGTCTSLLIDIQVYPRWWHSLGHIEDVSVDAKYQGTGVGGTLVKAVLEAAAKMGCYKTILDCQDEIMKFYEKIGFKKSATTMRFDH